MTDMRRVRRPIHTFAQIVALLVLAGAVGCSSHGDSTPTTSPNTPAATPAITMTASVPTLNVTQGATANVTVTVTRTGGYTGDVVVTAEGLPAGVSASALTIASASVTGIVTLTATSTATIGTANVTLRGSGTAITSVTAGVGVTVAAPVVATVNATWNFCTVYFLPSWVAFQDGPNGVWKSVSANAGTPGSYTFAMTQSKGAVAFVRPGPPGFGYYETDVYYLTQAELVAYGTTTCPGGGGILVTGKTVMAPWTGLAATEGATLYLGDPGYMNGAASGQVTVTNVRSGTAGTSDIVVARYPFTNSLNVDGLIIRRGVNLTNGAVITPPFDLSPASAEVFALVPHTLTLSGLNGDAAFTSTSFATAGTSVQSLSQANPVGATSTFQTVPAAKLAAGDLHSLFVTAAVPSSGLTLTDSRSAGVVFSTGADQAVTLGPRPNSAVTSTLSAQTPVLLRAAISIQPEYNQTFQVTWYQNSAAGNNVLLYYSAGYLGSVTTFNSDIPNLNAAGYAAAYGLVASSSVLLQVQGSAWSVPTAFGTSPLVNNARFMSANKVQTVVP